MIFGPNATISVAYENGAEYTRRELMLLDKYLDYSTGGAHPGANSWSFGSRSPA